MKKLQRVLALIMAIVMMMGTMSMTAFATEGETGTTAPEKVFPINKTANGLDANGQTDVTLTVPGTVEGNIDVVFVLGGGISGNQKTVDAAFEVFEPLMASGKVTVRLGLVAVERGERVVLDLNSPEAVLKADTYKQLISDKFDYITTLPKGSTNLEGPLKEAKNMLDLSPTKDSNKYMFLIATGRVYCFDDESGKDSTILHKVKVSGTDYYYWGNYTWQSQRGGNGNMYVIPASYQNDYSNYWAKIKEWVAQDGDTYVYNFPADIAEDSASFETWYNKNNQDLKALKIASSRYGMAILDPVPTAADFATGAMATIGSGSNPQNAMNYDRGQYETYMAYQALVDEGYNCFAICSEQVKYQNNSPYMLPGGGASYTGASRIQIGHAFMDFLAGGKAPLIFELELDENGDPIPYLNPKTGVPYDYKSKTNEDFFTPVAEEILYNVSINSTVVDYIGKNENGNFEFIEDKDVIKLNVAGVDYITSVADTAKHIDENGEEAKSSYAFTAPVEGAEPTFWLDYFRGDGETTERFVWTFGENVSMERLASLTYKLQLTEKKTTDGTYTVPTNNSATLYPKDSDGNDGVDQLFPVPSVTYEVVSKVAIEGDKEWNDDEDRDGIRPEEIVVILKADDEVVARQTVKAGESQWLSDTTWHFDFGEWPAKDESGKTIVYTVEEIEVEGYESVINGNAKDGFVIENTHTPETITISGTKIWDDDSNRDGKRPASITVALMKGDEQIGEPQTVTAANQWTYSFTAYKYENGEEITNYSVKEIDVPADYEDTYSEENYDITNTYEPETITIEGKKVWDDANNQDGKRPTSIIVKLMDGETVVETKEVKAADGWAFSFTAPKYKDGGVEIAYTVIEDQEALKELGYSLQGIEVAEDGFVTITNAYTPGKTSVTVTKVWDDADNHDGKRPANVTVQLLADGQAVEGKTVVLSKDNNWTATFADLDEYKNGQKIAYSVEEPEVPEGYTSSKAYSEETGIWTITNSRGIEKVTVDGLKVWSDNEDQDGKRPASITVKLMDGETVAATQTVTAANNWAFSFTANKYKTVDGETVEIEYTVEEVVPAGYEATIKVNEETGFVTITNTKTSYEQVTVSGRKVWDDGNDRDGLRPTEINVKLFANGEYTGKMVTTNLELDTWTFKFEGLDANKNGQPIVYTVAEETVPNGYTATEGTKENGYKITNTHTPATVNISGQKIWNDKQDQYGKRPESIIINLLANGTPVASQKVSAETEWAFSFENQPVNADGVAIEYAVSEDAVTLYTTDIEMTQDEETGDYNVTVTNTCTYRPSVSNSEYSITINYWNKNTGASIAPQFTTVYEEGTAYNVSAYNAIAISGYTWDSTDKPELLTGTLTGNVVINVFYVANQPSGMPGGGDDYIILDDDVPLADTPATGDPLTVMAAVSALSGAGLFLTRKKREDEE